MSRIDSNRIPSRIKILPNKRDHSDQTNAPAGKSPITIPEPSQTNSQLFFDSYTLYRYSTCLYATADKRTGRPVPLAKMHCFRVGVDLLVHVYIMCTYVIVAQISRRRLVLVLVLDYCSTIHAGRRQCGCVLPSN